MRICHILSSMSIGGMERVVYDLVAAQTQSDNEVCLYCTDAEGPLFEFVLATKKECAFRKPSLLVLDFRLIAHMIRFLKSNKIEFIHAHNHLGLLYGSIGSVFTGIPFLVTLHGQGYGYSGKARFMERIAARYAKFVVAVSEDAKSAILKNRLSSDEKIRVVPNGTVSQQSAVSSQQSGQNRFQCGVPEDAFVIGSVGRLVPEKNYELLIRAFAVISKEARAKRFENKEIQSSGSLASSPLPLTESGIPNPVDPVDPVKNDSSGFQPPQTAYCLPLTAYLLLVGDGPEGSKLEKVAGDMGISDQVIFPGMQADVQSWLKCMDVFCLSSVTEGTSMTLLEAGACGLPSVVTDVGGNAEVVKDDVTGIVVPSEDEIAMSQAFEKLFANADLRRKMGGNARLRIEEEYSLNKMVQAYQKLYEEAVK